LYIGFAGLFVGSGIGFLIGFNIKPSAVIVTHMKAISATSYNGVEVSLIANTIFKYIVFTCIIFILFRA